MYMSTILLPPSSPPTLAYEPSSFAAGLSSLNRLTVLEVISALAIFCNAAYIIVFEVLMFADDLSVTTKILIGVGIEHLLILLKFFISMIVSDLPIEVALELRRQRNVRQQKIGDHFHTVEMEDNIDSPTAMKSFPAAHNSHIQFTLGKSVDMAAEDGESPTNSDCEDREKRSFIGHLS